VNAKYYSLDEAQAVLPRISHLMAIIQEARQEILRLRPEVWPALKKAANNGGNAQAGEMLASFRRLEASVKEIMRMGVFVKDIDTGLVDFLSIRDGREVFLCWRYGEEDIRFWHELHTGFAGRQPIDDKAL
jgi:hypothetical protein